MAEVAIEDSAIVSDDYVLSIGFTVPYDTDLKKIEEKVLKFAESVDGVVLEEGRKPAFRLENFGESGIDVALKIRMPLKTSIKKLRRELYNMLCDEGIDMPYDRMDLVFINGSSTGSMETNWRTQE
jgi:small-conductance mechanosensitive channel